MTTKTNTVNTNAPATIKAFRDENYFLSNFYNCKVLYNGIVYRNAEAAFQAQKMDNEEYRIWMSSLDGADARKAGKDVELVPDWDKKRIKVMHDVILAKFSTKELRQKLLATGDAEITHCNGWKDTFWGVYKGVGEDHLGKILMEVREEVKSLKGFDRRTEAKVGGDNLIEGAFVPESGQGYRASDMTNALREDAGANKTLSLSNLFEKGFTVSAKRPGTPEPGIHSVKFDGEPIVKSGYDGQPYVEINLVNAIGICWKAFVNAKEIDKMLEDISFYNDAILANKTGMQAINYLQYNNFFCWTLITEEGKLATYFNEEKFSKRMYVIHKIQGEKEMKKLREKEREDEKARMAEEAKMGREEKAPWED